MLHMTLSKLTQAPGVDDDRFLISFQEPGSVPGVREETVRVVSILDSEQDN